MAKADYAILLDALVQQYPNDWPVTVSRPTLAAIRQEHQYSGGPSLRARAPWAAVREENWSMTNTVTGETEPAAIYVMRRRGASKALAFVPAASAGGEEQRG